MLKTKSKLVHGVGIYDSDLPTQNEIKVGCKRKVVWRCPFYNKWVDMLRRCYSENSHIKSPTYIGCSVSDVWFTFSTFKDWMESQDWRGKHLDKDILIPGNKVYSPDTCALVDGVVNSFITDSAAARGEWPLGVYWKKDSNKFKAQCGNPFTTKQEHLGYFTNPQEAHQTWKRRKHELACQLADLQTDERVAEALRTRYIQQNGGNNL